MITDKKDSKRIVRTANQMGNLPNGIRTVKRDQRVLLGMLRNMDYLLNGTILDKRGGKECGTIIN
jgi:hypothetical protein